MRSERSRPSAASRRFGSEDSTGDRQQLLREDGETQLGVRVDGDVAELATTRAADLGLSMEDYLAGLVQGDAGGLRARAVGAASRFLADHQGMFDEAEHSQQPAPGHVV
jgi:hypothetical protein